MPFPVPVWDLGSLGVPFMSQNAVLIDHAKYIVGEFAKNELC